VVGQSTRCAPANGWRWGSDGSVVSYDARALPELPVGIEQVVDTVVSPRELGVPRRRETTGPPQRYTDRLVLEFAYGRP
jgi:hypothetical protein